MATVVLQYWAPSVLFKRRILYLKEGVPCRIGRCHKNEFAFTNNALFKTSYPHISHYHAFLVFAKDKFFLQDSSSNGTFVNGNLVGKLSSCQIFSEDIVKLGKDYHFDGEFQCFCFKITLTVGDVDFRYSKLIEEEYPNSLHLYSKPPTTEDMSLSVLYDKTLERFEVLQIFDSYGDIDLNKCTEFKYIINRIKEKGFINFYHYLAEESFPLCMNILNYYLNKNHHLRNGGRFQYGLFLKGSGMPLSDALIFWRNHFTKKMDVKHFEKQYSYHIRHLYGAVGKMFSYPPHDCNTILKVMAGPVEYHGCPFKLLNKENIFFELKRNQISDTDAEQIWEIMKCGFPQLACAKYFNVQHNSSESITVHPNSYFERSQTLRLADKGKDTNLRGVPLDSCVSCTSKQLEW
ncbi:DNA primase large subunit-like isoform X4 [Rhodnius prolixus]|uniref:DNA primase large subunit-like isoform X4 n=1 Tax=Rhodnius prolixus TaxID=13249 RepID=UPI003D18ED85